MRIRNIGVVQMTKRQRRDLTMLDVLVQTQSMAVAKTELKKHKENTLKDVAQCQ